MRIQVLVVVLAFLCAAIPAVAGPVVTDPATFFAQLEPGAIGVIDFSTLSIGSIPSPYTIANAQYSLNITATGGLYVNDDHGDRFLRASHAQTVMTIAFGAGINAFGAVMYQTNGSMNGNTVPTTVTFTDEADNHFTYAIAGPSSGTFVGYAAPWGSYLKSATITGGNSANSYVTIDDVVAGFDTPEPATILLCGLGLIAAGFLKRRR